LIQAKWRSISARGWITRRRHWRRKHGSSSFGEYDGFAIVEGGDNIDTAAAAMIVGASGAVRTKTTVLLTPDEIDKAAQKGGKDRPPGQ
jgi:hypothetical protein